jgi:hypothetical protein
MGRVLLLSSSITAAVAGAGFAFAAWQSRSTSFGLFGATLLLVSPALGVAASPMSIGPVDPVDATLLSAATDRLHESGRFLRAVRVCRAVALLGLSYAVVLCMSQLGGLVDAPRFVACYTLLSVAAAAIYLPWLSARERAALAVHSELQHRLAQFRSGRHWSAG